MEYEEEMRPEKNTMPNYFNEWSTFDDLHRSSMTIIKYVPVYDNNIEVNYESDEEYYV